MISRLLAALLATILSLPAAAATVHVTQSATFDTGVFAGETLRFDITYPMLPDGGQIWAYGPEFTARVEFLDAISTTPSSAEIVFSGSCNIFLPELYLIFNFTPEQSPLGVREITFFASSIIQVTMEGDPGPTDYPCSNCTYSAAVVPLPASGVLLLGGLAVLGWRSRRRAFG